MSPSFVSLVSALLRSALSRISNPQTVESSCICETAAACRMEFGDTAQRCAAATKQTKDGDKRFSLSPQRGEGRGEGWKRDMSWPRSEVFHRTTPHPHSLSPLRGEGGLRRRARKNLRCLRRFGQILIDWKSALQPGGTEAFSLCMEIHCFTSSGMLECFRNSR